MNTMIPDVALMNNTSQRLPCAIVLDGSSSMDGTPIAELNAGLKALEAELKSHSIARQRVQLLLIRLGGNSEVEVITPWTDAMEFVAPDVEANGNTPLGEAVRLALFEIEQQKAAYDVAGIASNRPWLFIFTDGQPTDSDWLKSAEACRAAEAAEKVVVFPIAIGDSANLIQLAEFSTERAPARVDQQKLSDLFVWLGRSARSGSMSAPGAPVQMASPSSWMTAPG